MRHPLSREATVLVRRDGKPGFASHGARIMVNVDCRQESDPGVMSGIG